MLKKISLRLLFFMALFTFVNNAIAQPAWTFNLLDTAKRAKQFEDRKAVSVAPEKQKKSYACNRR